MIPQHNRAGIQCARAAESNVRLDAGDCRRRRTIPPQIILFLENLWDEAEENESAFQNEVRITYLHELGHYLGLDEGDLFERGLE